MESLKSQYIIKIASGCNLNCSYCYVYNLADQSWRSKPPTMSEEIFSLTINAIERYARSTGSKRISILFHGGEPCLVGVARFRRMCDEIKRRGEGSLGIDLSIQTNATLIDREWADAFLEHQVDVGISLDGPRDVNDKARVDHKRRGSYDRIVDGIRLVMDAGVPTGILCVIPLGENPLSVHHHFLSLGIRAITYLLPHYTHDNIAAVRARFGQTPCADFLIPIFDEWSLDPSLKVCVHDLKNIAHIILGAPSFIDTYGGEPGAYVTVETDGTVEGLDSLRACAQGLSVTGSTVRDLEFGLAAEPASASLMRSLPSACRPCEEAKTCAGGYFPHRYSRQNAFDNPSVWCADILKLFRHVRQTLQVSPADTAALAQLRENSSYNC